MRRFCMTSILAIAIPLVGAAAQPSPHAFTKHGPPARSRLRRRRDARGMGRSRSRRSHRGGRAGAGIATADETIDLPGTTLMPGLIEGHSHVLLHPYNETTWNDQVLHESRSALRIARATNHLRATLMAGFTTIRDLGTEGAAYADAELKQAVDQGIIPGPRMLVDHARDRRDRAATARRGSRSSGACRRAPKRPTATSLMRVVRDQIGHGADWIKVYADYRWGARGEAAPTFSLEELKTIVETARSSGRPVVAHASTRGGHAARGARRASKPSSTATAGRRRSSR